MTMVVILVRVIIVWCDGDHGGSDNGAVMVVVVGMMEMV